MADAFIGEIRMFAGSRVPRDWLLCDGSTLDIPEYTMLYAILGTTYGGDGRTNFSLPDLRGRVPIGAGQSLGTSYYQQGQRGGYENITLHNTQMPQHNHTAAADIEFHPLGVTSVNLSFSEGIGDLKVFKGEGDTTDPSTATSMAGQIGTGMNKDKLLSKNSSTEVIKGAVKNISAKGNIDMTNIYGTTTVTVGNTGGSQPHENRQPFLAINYIICTDGIFPSPN